MIIPLASATTTLSTTKITTRSTTPPALTITSTSADAVGTVGSSVGSSAPAPTKEPDVRCPNGWVYGSGWCFRVERRIGSFHAASLECRVRWKSLEYRDNVYFIIIRSVAHDHSHADACFTFQNSFTT